MLQMNTYIAAQAWAHLRHLLCKDDCNLICELLGARPIPRPLQHLHSMETQCIWKGRHMPGMVHSRCQHPPSCALQL